MPTRKIAVEEAFTIDRPADAQHTMESAMNPSWADYVSERITDLVDLRLREMDDEGIDVQVLSLTSPGIQGIRDTAEAVATAREANDLVAGVVRDHPTRFAAFAALPCQDPAGQWPSSTGPSTSSGSGARSSRATPTGPTSTSRSTGISGRRRRRWRCPSTSTPPTRRHPLPHARATRSIGRRGVGPSRPDPMHCE